MIISSVFVKNLEFDILARKHFLTRLRPLIFPAFSGKTNSLYRHRNTAESVREKTTNLPSGQSSGIFVLRKPRICAYAFFYWRIRVFLTMILQKNGQNMVYTCFSSLYGGTKQRFFEHLVCLQGA